MRLHLSAPGPALRCLRRNGSFAKGLKRRNSIGLGLDSGPRARSPECVECGRCGRSNPGHVRYCLDCGSVLRDASAPAKAVGPTQVPARVACTSCGIDNPTGARFCRECGEHLPESDAKAEPSGTEKAASPVDSRPSSDKPFGGTLVVASRPPEPYNALKEPDVSGTLASAQDSPITPPPAGRRSREPRQPNVPLGQGGYVARNAPPVSREPREDAPPPPPMGGASPQPVAAPAPQAGGRTCRACGGTSGAAARFCQLCGLPLDRASGERPRSNPPQLHAETMPDAELVVIAQDGSPGRRYPLAGVRTMIGSADTDISLRKDPYVSPQHAQISYRNGRFYLEDCGSLNGVFVRLGGSVPLTSGDLLLLGLGVLRFEIVDESERNLAPQSRNGTRVFGTPPAPRYARLTTQTVEGVARDRYYLSRAETVLGREVGDIVFTDDPFMSRRHAAIRRDPNTNHFAIRDLGSSNGTFIALRTEHALSPGDHIRIGQHLFRLDVRSSR